MGHVLFIFGYYLAVALIAMVIVVRGRRVLQNRRNHEKPGQARSAPSAR